MADYKVVGHYEYEGDVFCCIFPKEALDAVKELSFNKSDVMVATYPKAGTTWMEEIVDLIMKNADLSKVMNMSIDRRIPFLEMVAPDSPHGDPLQRFRDGASPRIVKTHLPYKFYENTFEKEKPKCVIVMRNVKDNLVSYYHFYQSLKPMGNFPGSFKDFFELFKAKRIVGGDWADFNLSWWEHREDPNLHFTTYEAMKKDPIAEIKKVANFLGKDLTEEQFELIADHTSFNKMKSNPMTNKSDHGQKEMKNPFMRKGIVGDWKNQFDEEMLKYVEDYLHKNLDGTGLSFKD